MTLNHAYTLYRNRPLGSAIAELELALAEYPESPFRICIGATFLSDVANVTAFLETFVSLYPELSALYIELNGFTINTKQWHADLFGFRDYLGSEDWDWLAQWIAESDEPCRLEGMDEVRRVFEKYYSLHEPLIENSKPIAEALVVLRFNESVIKAVQRARGTSALLRNRVMISNAHDYDFFQFIDSL